MNKKQVLDELKHGAVLHMEHDNEGDMAFWLDFNRRIGRASRRRTVRRDIALKIIKENAVTPERDGLFDGVLPQTWRAA